MKEYIGTGIFDTRKAIVANIIDKEVLTKGNTKGGEGSRGGKIIGHTTSGKPIYEKSIHNSKDFTHEDHSDAVSAHMKASKDHNESYSRNDKKAKSSGSAENRADEDSTHYRNNATYHREQSQHHSQMAELHSNAMNKKLDEKNNTLEKGQLADSMSNSYNNPITINKTGKELLEKVEDLLVKRETEVSNLNNQIDSFIQAFPIPPTESLSDYYYRGFKDQIGDCYVYPYDNVLCENSESNPFEAKPIVSEEDIAKQEALSKLKRNFNDLVYKKVDLAIDIEYLKFLIRNTKPNQNVILAQQQALILGF